MYNIFKKTSEKSVSIDKLHRYYEKHDNQVYNHANKSIKNVFKMYIIYYIYM